MPFCPGATPGAGLHPLIPAGNPGVYNNAEHTGTGLPAALRWGRGEGPAAVCGPTQLVWGERFLGSPRPWQVPETSGLLR